MANEQLWAPWRLPYIVRKEEAEPPVDPRARWAPGADTSCFLCRDVAELGLCDRQNRVVAQTPHTIAVLNRYPYNNGHLLVAPRFHKAHPGELSDDEHLALGRALARLITALERLVAAQGFNVGMNLGQVAGAGLPGHLHWHIVPRWGGDTNFMSVTAATDVIPQSLDAMWEALREALAE